MLEFAMLRMNRPESMASIAASAEFRYQRLDTSRAAK
jgi:hypothetical protein